MALRIIRENGDELLRKKARPVKEIDEKILMLLDDMSETMRSKDGIGLAAPQVGVLRRIALVDMKPGEGEAEIVELINPEIVEQRGSQINNEACLSLPGGMGYVERPEYVKVQALDREGRPSVYEGCGMVAIAFCHEIDHLDGVLYIDKIIEDYEPDEGEDFEEDGESRQK